LILPLRNQIKFMDANPDPANSETGSNVAQPQAGQTISILRIGILLLPVVLVVLLLDGRVVEKIRGNPYRSHPSAALNAIINNLRSIAGAKDQWALETKRGPGAVPTWANLAGYLKNNFQPDIVNETYTINPVGTPAMAKTPVKLGTYPAGSVITIP
jgi:hypothetical protein